jgi:hypothetical protein
VSYATLKLQSAPLRYVVHFVGDIHQPLHCASRVSAQHPGGDEGGLKFAVARTYGQKHLHGLWDQGGRLFRLNMPRPLTAYGYSLIQTLARDIMETYPATNFVAQLAETSVAAWANEGFDLAKTNVYVGVQPGGAPSSDYLHKLETTASRQVALAGYRLAALLNEIFK